MDAWMDVWLQLLLWLRVNIAANTFSTQAFHFTATAAFTLAATAVTAAYDTASEDPLLGKWECLCCDSSRDIL